MPILINFVAYQGVWFACVLGAAHQFAWLGTSLALVLVVTHVLVSLQRAAELKLLLAAACIGFTVDSVLATAQLIQFNAGVWANGITPHWMLALWLAFATTLNVSMRWLTARPKVAILFGAIGGPLAYYSGMKLGALAVPNIGLGLLATGAAWSAAMWLLSIVAVRVNARVNDVVVLRKQLT